VQKLERLVRRVVIEYTKIKTPPHPSQTAKILGGGCKGGQYFVQFHKEGLERKILRNILNQKNSKKHGGRKRGGMSCLTH